MIRAVALLEENPDPSEEEITARMNLDYCRCGTYGRIKRAVLRAAAQMSSAQEAGSGGGAE
jgi:isoquinoline 1-oxidoreductase alpha subunit